MIQANIDGNFVVDVFNRESHSETNVWSYRFNGTPAQLWKLVLIEKLPVFLSYSKKATQKVTAYVMPDLQAKSGDEYVSAGDNVTVLREEGDAVFIRYPVRGGTKERWVNKNDIFGDVDILDNIEFDWPVPGYYKINTKYTYSDGTPHWSRYKFDGRMCGIDISVPYGTWILAPQSGVVQSKENLGSKSFGKYFEILHDDGTITLYGHLSNYDDVYNGKRVNKGEKIAQTGNSGRSKGPHLHFELSNYDTYQYYKNKGIIK